MDVMNIPEIQGGFMAERKVGTGSSVNKDAMSVFSSYLNKINSSYDFSTGVKLVEDVNLKIQDKITSGGPQNALLKNVINPFQQKLENSKEEIADFGKEVVEVIADTLGITLDEVEEAMEILGLTVFDMLNPENLSQVVMKLTGVTDSSQMIFSSQFQDILQDVTDSGKNLMAQMDITPNQLESLLAEMDILEQPEVMDVENLMNESVVILNEANENVILENEQQEGTETLESSIGNDLESNLINGIDIEEMSGQQNVVSLNGTEENVKDSGKNNSDDSIIEDISIENLEISNTEDTSEGFLNNNSSDFEQEQNKTDIGSKKEELHNGNGISANVNEPIVNTNTQSAQQVTQYTSVNSSEIINQIVEQARVNVNSEEINIQMQLNPENLGKVYLNVSEKEGIVNAHLTVTNEIVKQALETQMVALKENLVQAGVKVDAIEVTVASHEFERNLEQGQMSQEQQNQQKGENQQGDGRRRNLNMSNLDELSGIMSEEEMLVAQMMKDNGNSVDLTA